MKQAIGYIRVSTEKQANEGVSLEAQEAKIVTWCKANGYELVKVYVDAGISGKRMDTRKELLAALASLKKGMALVSYSLSRLARSTKDALAIGEAVAKKKADMVSLTEQIDTTTAAGKMMFPDAVCPGRVRAQPGGRAHHQRPATQEAQRPEVHQPDTLRL